MEEFTEEQKKKAEELVEEIVGKDKFEATLTAIAEKLESMVDENKENNAFVLLVHNEDTGNSLCSMSGTGISIITTMVSVCEKCPDFKVLFMEAATYMARQGLKKMFGEDKL